MLASGLAIIDPSQVSVCFLHRWSQPALSQGFCRPTSLRALRSLLLDASLAAVLTVHSISEAVCWLGPLLVMVRIPSLSASVREFVPCYKLEVLLIYCPECPEQFPCWVRMAPAKMGKVCRTHVKDSCEVQLLVDRCKLCHVVEARSQTRVARIQRYSSFTVSLSGALSVLSSATENVMTWFGQMLIICVSFLWQGSSASLFLSNASPHESCSVARTPRQYVNTNNK